MQSLFILILLVTAILYFPTSTNSFPNSLLVTVNMYNFANHEASIDLFQSYKDICEAGWRIKVVLITAAEWSNDSISLLNERMYCYRSNTSVPLEIWSYNRSEGAHIVMHSREPTQVYIQDFDLFLYVEG